MSARGAADGGLQNLWRYKIEQPLREGYMSKQSGGAIAKGGRRRRASVGELVKKWDERYFVLTAYRLYYFKNESDLRDQKEPKGIIELHEAVIEFDDEISDVALSLRESGRVYSLKTINTPMTLRWVTALRTVQLSAMTSPWSAAQLSGFMELSEFPQETRDWVEKKHVDGLAFAGLRSGEDLAALGYPDLAPREQLWALLKSMRTEATHEWLIRYSKFVDNLKVKRELKEPEVECWQLLMNALKVVDELQNLAGTTSPKAGDRSPAVPVWPSAGAGGAIAGAVVDEDDEDYSEFEDPRAGRAAAAEGGDELNAEEEEDMMSGAKVHEMEAKEMVPEDAAAPSVDAPAKMIAKALHSSGTDEIAPM